MAKFHGKVGFGSSVESRPGVHTDEIVEYSYFGDIIQNRRTLRQEEVLSKDLSISNSISIVADAYARGNVFAIKYVEWAGERWTVTDVEVQRPRLILQLGEVYNGPTAGASVTP
jgi:hypothetical protein